LLDIPFTIAGFPNKALSIDAIIAAILASIAMGLITTVIGLVVHD
jgi:hypothetical protein